MSKSERPWPLGPYRLLRSAFERKRGEEVGTSVSFGYPLDQYTPWDAVAQHAQGSLMVLAPEMAEAILAWDAAYEGDFDGSVFEKLHQVAEKILAIDGLMDWSCECGYTKRGQFSMSPKCPNGHWLMPEG